VASDIITLERCQSENRLKDVRTDGNPTAGSLGVCSSFWVLVAAYAAIHLSDFETS
jgi:hypothetical protein